MEISRILVTTLLAILSTSCKSQETAEAPEEADISEYDEQLFIENAFLRQGNNSYFGQNATEAVVVSSDCVRVPEKLSCPDSRVSFFLYAGSDTNGEFINQSDPNWLANSKFDKSKPSVLFIHGFGGGDDIGSMPLLRDAYIMTEKYNVINADWEALARWPCYFQAINNLKPVAKCTAHFLVNLEKSLGVQYEKITCVGLSLGAHVCGLIQNYVADKMQKIIALDPAKPLLQSKNKKDRLDAADAVQVQVIHTNAGFYGMSGQQGHVDFCINGGRTQTYCKNTPDDNYCSHIHALCYLAESVFPEKARKAVPCDSRCPYPLGRFKTRSGANATVGEEVESSASGMYCVETTTPPYCKDEDSDDPEYGDARCCPLTDPAAVVVVTEEPPKMSISNFKLGERPAGEHPRRGDDEEADETPPPVKGCVQKPKINCPDPHVKFYLYAGDNPRRVWINASSDEWFDESGFDVDKPSVVLMHGYQGGENAMPTVILREAYIKNGSYNLIAGDYPALVKERCDRFARINAEPIAKCTAHLINHLQRFGVRARDVTCVGFSLGAHICGLVANFIADKMHKIVALDPSGGRPNKRNLNKRLDEDDAISVHAIHTDTWRYGEGDALGTADVCVNNGRQPFCKNSINNQPLCSHASSVCFFAESLFPELERQVEPCLGRCPQPLWGDVNGIDGDNATFGAAMDRSASGMFCLETDVAPYCPASDDEVGDPRCCIVTKKV